VQFGVIVASHDESAMATVLITADVVFLLAIFLAHEHMYWGLGS
jgi:hypothetical protein